MRLQLDATAEDRREWLDHALPGTLLSWPVVLWCLGHDPHFASETLNISPTALWADYGRWPVEDVRGYLDGEREFKAPAPS